MTDALRTALWMALDRLASRVDARLPADAVEALVSLHAAAARDHDHDHDHDLQAFDLLRPEELRFEEYYATGRALGADVWNPLTLAYYEDPLPVFWSLTFAKTRKLDDHLMLMIGGRSHGQVLSWDVPHPDVGGREAWSLSALAAKRAGPPATLATPSGPVMSAPWQAELRRAGVVFFEGCALLLAHDPVQGPALHRLEQAIGRPVPEDLVRLWATATRGIVLYRHAPGVDTPGRFDRILSPDEALDPRFRHLVGDGRTLRLPWEHAEAGDRFELVPVACADHAMDCVYYVCVADDDRGALYRAVWGRGDAPDRLERVADSLSSYMGVLRFTDDADAREDDDAPPRDAATEALTICLDRIGAEIRDTIAAQLREHGQRSPAPLPPAQCIGAHNADLVPALLQELERDRGDITTVSTPPGTAAWLQVYGLDSDSYDYATSGLRSRVGAELVIRVVGGATGWQAATELAWVIEVATAVAETGLPAVTGPMSTPAGPFTHALTLPAYARDVLKLGEVEIPLYAVIPITEYEAFIAKTLGPTPLPVLWEDELGLEASDCEDGDPQRATLAPPESPERRIPDTLRQWCEAAIERLVTTEQLLLTEGTAHAAVVELVTRLVYDAARNDRRLTVGALSTALLDEESLVDDLFVDDDALHQLLVETGGSPTILVPND